MSTPDRQGRWAMAPEGPGRAWRGTGQREQNVQQVMPCQGLGGAGRGLRMHTHLLGRHCGSFIRPHTRGLGSMLKGSGSGAGR